MGDGPPLVKAANWLNHLEHEWESPVWKHWVADLSQHHVFVRYDERGCGLSDWNVPDFSFDAWVRDLETVVDALGVERFALLGISQGGAVAAAYAARHPERVSHLILYCAHARGWQHRGNAQETRGVRRRSLNWCAWVGARTIPPFARCLQRVSSPMPVPQRWSGSTTFNGSRRRRRTPRASWTSLRRWMCARCSPTSVAPTIVFHCQEDGVVPFNEGRLLAAGIRGAKFVPLPSRNHLVLAHEPAWQILLRELGEFLGWPSEERAG